MNNQIFKQFDPPVGGFERLKLRIVRPRWFLQPVPVVSFVVFILFLSFIPTGNYEKSAEFANFMARDFFVNSLFSQQLGDHIYINNPERRILSKTREDDQVLVFRVSAGQ